MLVGSSISLVKELISYVLLHYYPHVVVAFTVICIVFKLKCFEPDVLKPPPPPVYAAFYNQPKESTRVITPSTESCTKEKPLQQNTKHKQN